MEKRRILYRLGSSGRDEWLFKISNELQNKVEHIPFFQCTRANSDFIAENKINEENILCVDDGEKTKIKEPDLQFLHAIEEKFNFNIWDVWDVVAQRSKKQRRTPQNTILATYEYDIKGFDSFLDKNKITDYVIFGSASSSDLILFQMMKQKGINVISLATVPIQKRFGIVIDLTNKLYSLKENYNELKDFTEEEEENASKLLQEYREKKYKPDCTITFKESKIKKIKRYSKAGWKMIKFRAFPSTFRPLLWGVIQKSYDHMGIFENPVEGEKFVLYPLHFQPEITTSWYGKWYDDQLNIIENIARSLPVDYKLYVKEHSNGYGNRNLRFYKEIKKYSNVRLISPHADNLDLIKKSSLVTTITGTSGWEAIMFQKPVIIFGDIFYEVFDCVKKIENIRNLPTTIRESLDKKVDYKETLTCLVSLIRSTYPGLARLPGDCANHSLNDENIKLLAEGISNHIKLRCENKISILKNCGAIQ